MSAEKRKARARRWITSAESDERASKLLADNNQFALSCFHSQQAAEKAIKAVMYYQDLEPWGAFNIKSVKVYSQVSRNERIPL